MQILKIENPSVGNAQQEWELLSEKHWKVFILSCFIHVLFCHVKLPCSDFRMRSNLCRLNRVFAKWNLFAKTKKNRTSSVDIIQKAKRSRILQAYMLEWRFLRLQLQFRIRSNCAILRSSIKTWKNWQHHKIAGRYWQQCWLRKVFEAWSNLVSYRRLCCQNGVQN